MPTGPPFVPRGAVVILRHVPGIVNIHEYYVRILTSVIGIVCLSQDWRPAQFEACVCGIRHGDGQIAKHHEPTTQAQGPQSEAYRRKKGRETVRRLKKEEKDTT